MEKRIASIQIDIELIMYGYVGFCLTGSPDSVFASWIVIADGGEVVSSESKEIAGKNFITLTETISIINLPNEEDEQMSRCWDIIFCDDKNNEIKSIERGYWDIDILNKVISIIEEFTGDTEITEWLHNIIEA